MSLKIRTTSISNLIEEKWQNIVNMVAEILNVPSAIITRLETPLIEVVKSAETKANPYHAGDKVEMAKHYCETVMVTNKKLEVNYAPEDPSWKNAPELKYGMVAYLGFPVQWPTGEMFGTICILDSQKNSFGEHYERILLQFRDVVELHLELTDKILQLENRNIQLEKAFLEIKTLKNMLPICSKCKKIRDNEGNWHPLEEYIHQNVQIKFSHSICPLCEEELYSDLEN
ncbi:GAF domain-containing protein [Candidatus Lokiarchaeum ossiferum]|uniref:GAF domain-containing protein n=1 Tax=Candidatus Lokiarchaeum ossiferum TaxID=2951803 RepID=UPI00352DB434